MFNSTRFVAIASLLAIATGCHSDAPARPVSPVRRAPPTCDGTLGPALTVAQAIANSTEAAAVIVDGYLVRRLGTCTMMNCPHELPNCNSCEVSLRLASAPSNARHALSLRSSRLAFTCWSNLPERCAFDGTGQHVIARGKLHFPAASFDTVSLKETEICSVSQ